MVLSVLYTESTRECMSLAVTVRLDRFRMNRGLPQQKEICYAQVPRHSISRRLHRSCVTGCLGTVVNSSAQLGALVNSSAQLGALVNSSAQLGALVNSSAQLGALVVEP